MTGLEKITDRILAEARAQSDEIREKAEEEAGAVLRETEERLSRLREEAKEREALVKKELETRARSSASLKKRQLILAAKQDMIREQIEKAHQTLLEMEPEEYFSLIADCLRLLPPHIVIHRISGDGPKSLLKAPLWSGNKRFVLNSIAKTLRETGAFQGEWA